MAPSMARYRDEYIDAFKSLGGDAEGRQKALDHIAGSDVWAYGAPVAFSYIPHLLGADDVRFMRDCCETTHRILCKVIDRYLHDAEYRKVFRYPEALERLIMLPCSYDELLPMARFDIFLDERDLSYKFCEFNTDGSGAFSRDLEMGRALACGSTYQRFAELHDVRNFELFDTWVEAFMETYRSWPFAVDAPTIAITDYEESGVMSDFRRFIEAFERAGYPARFVDVRSFAFDGEALVDPSDGTRIDAIYRRSVTSEILQKGGCDAFIDAIAAEKVCCIGHFRTTVVHTKAVSIVLFDKMTRAFLTEEEAAFIDAHVPRTYRLEAGAPIDFAAVKADKDGWILKPEDDYGAHGVHAGVDCSAEEWAALVDALMDTGYVVQEFYTPHLIDLTPTALPADGDATRIEAWHTMPGLYSYNGRFAGLYCREGREGVIALDHGGIASPSFRVDC